MIHDLFGNSTIKADPLGLPYMGSKRKYANDLICKMLEQKPHAKYFYDLFGGGGAMSFAALQKGMTVFYNEKQTCLVNFIAFIFECIKEPKSEFGIFPPEYYNFITREEFIRLRTESGNYAQFARICYSFGNNQKCYLYNPELEVKKHLMHDVVVFRCEKSLAALNEYHGSIFSLSDKKTYSERRLDLRKNIFEFYSKSKKGDNEGIMQQLQQLESLERLQILESLERLQSLQRLQSLERLERLESLESKITFTNLDYRDVQITTPIAETIVYCDPPYRGTAKYIEDLNYDNLDKWFLELPYLAFMSEYTAPFKSIYEIKTRSTLSAQGSCPKIEKLYVNGTN